MGGGERFLKFCIVCVFLLTVMIVVSTVPVMVDPRMTKKMSEIQLLPAAEPSEGRLRIATHALCLPCCVNVAIVRHEMDDFLLWRVGDEGKGGGGLEMRWSLKGSGGGCVDPVGTVSDKGSPRIFCGKV